MENPAFTVTPSAATQIHRSAPEQNTPISLRVAAKRDAAGAIVYGMGLDDERENDLVLDCEGVTILIAPFSAPLLRGATLDFVELTPGEFQFIFVNPNDAPEPQGGCGSGGCANCGGQ
jgi:iron-sulfur cluster assembly protein